MAFMQRFWQQLRAGLTNKNAKPAPPSTLPHFVDNVVDDAPEPTVPEITVKELRELLAHPMPPLLIDVREPYEWRLVRMAMARHLPMNDIPDQVATLPRDQTLVILCAHGSRSYSVAGWLIEQGFDAMSLAGGISEWARQGGAVVQGADEG